MSDDLKKVVEYFTEILEIPNYYTFKTHYSDTSMYDLVGSIDNINVYVLVSTEFCPEMNFNVNDRIMITDNIDYITFFLKLDTFIGLIIEDIIKTLGGVLNEKTTLLY